MVLTPACSAGGTAVNARGTLPVAVAILLLVAAVVPSAAGVSPKAEAVDVTTTTKGRELAQTVAARHSNLGVRTTPADLKVWRLGSEYLIGERLPDNLKNTVTKSADGSTTVELSFDVGVPGAHRSKARSTDVVAAADPTWKWLDQACFSRMGSALYGFLDSCFSLHRLASESNPRDFYKLEHYGTLGAGMFTKMYDGWLAAAKASSGSSAMRWVDWNPRGNVVGSCQQLNLQVQALGVNFTSPAFFCENNIPTKYASAGSFRMTWSCGCIIPWGQPAPNTREIDYLQAVSVPNGGSVRWTLSAGYSIR
jgi:hypothetical protein